MREGEERGEGEEEEEKQGGKIGRREMREMREGEGRGEERSCPVLILSREGPPRVLRPPPSPSHLPPSLSLEQKC